MRTTKVRAKLARGAVGRMLVAGIAAATVAAAAPSAWGQQRGGGGSGGGGGGGGGGQPRQAAKQPSILDDVLTEARSRDWTLRINIDVRSYQHDGNGVEAPRIDVMNLASAAVVFPMLARTASSEMDFSSCKGELSFENRVVDDKPSLIDGYMAGARLARWQLKEQTGREMSLSLELPIRAWSTTFDEKAAERVPWPSKWSGAAETALKADSIVDSADETVLALVKNWTGGQDPKKIPPVQLAKFLASKVWEHVQISGNGLAFVDSQLMGVDLQKVGDTAKSGRGSEHDMVVLLAAVYRAAGLPARTVIGFDVSAKKDNSRFLDRGKRGPQKLRAWVEFCLYDETTSREAWIPVDVVRMRSTSSRAQSLNRPWRYFGTHDELEMVIPFAFQYHPPTTVVAHGAYGFWGWMPSPEVPNVKQTLRFDAITTPKRSTDRRDRR